MRLGFGVHADARVGHPKHDVAPRRDVAVSRGTPFGQLDIFRLDGQPPAGRHRVARIDRQIDQRLLDLGRIRTDRAEVPCERGHEVHILADQPPEHLAHLSDQVVQVEDPRLQHLPRAEGEELANQHLRARRRVPDDVQFLSFRGVGGRVEQEQLNGAENRREHVVEVVGDASREPPHGLQPLRLLELLLQPLVLAPHGGVRHRS